MTVIPTDVKAPPSELGKARVLLGYLVHDKLALLSAIYLLFLVLAAIFGPLLVGDMATKLGLRQRNLAPFSLDQGWAYVLGADTLGRSILARLVVGAQNTLGIAAAAVLTSALIGGALGLIAGYSNRWYSQMIMRLADIIMSFPSLLLALIVLYQSVDKVQSKHGRHSILGHFQP
jgi:peptide/nickel transport system permease protein